MMTLSPALAGEASMADGRSTRNGTVFVENPAEPAEPMRKIPCRELWRVGGDRDVAGAPLGFVTDVAVDEDGNAYLLDNSLSRVHVFDSAGRWLRSIGREGEGPGEFRRAETFLILPQGDLGVLQPMSAQVVGLTRDGLPAPTVTFRGNEGLKFIGLIDAVSNRVVVSLTERVRRNGDPFIVETLATYDRRGNHVSTILERTIRQADQGASADEDGNASFADNWTVSDDGRIFVSRRPHEYRIEVFDLEGTLQQIIRRQYTPVRLSEEELSEETARIERLRRMIRGSGVTLEVDPYKRDISRMHVRPRGELWVRTSRGDVERPEGTIGVFDVFNAAGQYIRQVCLQIDYDPERDDFELIGDRLFLVKQGRMRPSYVSASAGMTVRFDNDNLDTADAGGEGAPLEVVCYRLQE